MKVSHSNPLAVADISGRSPSARQAPVQPNTESTPQQAELNINSASQSIFGGKPERIAELRNQVESGTYKPDAALVSEKLINGAISRPE